MRIAGERAPLAAAVPDRGEPDDETDEPLEQEVFGSAALDGGPSASGAGPESDAPDDSGPLKSDQDGEASADVAVPDHLVTAAEDAPPVGVRSAGGEITPENLVAHLEQTIGYGKTAWPLAVMRRFADVLIEVAAGRRQVGIAGGALAESVRVLLSSRVRRRQRSVADQ